MAKWNEVLRIEEALGDRARFAGAGALAGRRRAATATGEFAMNGIDATATPSAIVRYLDQYVIGQDDAKKIVAVAVYAHFRKIARARPGPGRRSRRATCC